MTPQEIEELRAEWASLPEGFRSTVRPDPETACLVWIGSRNEKGYGKVGEPGRGSAYVHRVVWEHLHGPIPDGMVVRHRCDNPPCCRPGHLEIGTYSDNANDAVERGLWNRPPLKTECHRGHSLTDPENVYVKASGVRVCRACRTISQRAWRERQRGERS